ncbi:Pre-mRNA-splicing factor slt11, partial [Dipsacomyces acuminosporus]
HGLPVQVRDTALSIQDSVPKEDANRQAYLAKTANSIEVMGEQPDFSGRAQPVGREMLKRMSRKDPYYKRNRPHICSFFVKGQCNRGNECPYRHEMPQGDPELAKQNIVDRYHGTNDPVAKRMLSRANRTDKLSLPEDKSITSLFVMGMDKSITQSDLRDHFYTFGELKSVVVVPKGNCAFINFKTRAAAEAASQAAMGGCVIKGVPLRLAWGKAKPKGPQSEIASKGTGSGETTRESHPTRASIPLPPGAVGSAESEAYPSQDPTVLGSNS